MISELLELLPEVFKNIRKGKEDPIISKFILSDRRHGGDYAEISYFLSDTSELRFFLDNYPRPKKFYSTNFPIKSYDELKTECSRIGIELEYQESYVPSK